MHHHMGRAQYAKGSKKGHLHIGRNNACRANAAEIDPYVRVAMSRRLYQSLPSKRGT
jgi:hypothetical protein